MQPLHASLTPLPAPVEKPGGAQAAPVVPFLPRELLSPIFFLHIPKTSGSSWNALLRDAFGDDNFQEHVEYLLPLLLRREREPLRADCVSAHIPLNNWRRYRGTDAYERVTVLRDPWARLVSHINWIDRFNHGKTLEGQGPQREKIAHVAALIDATDFTDRASLIGFRDRLHDKGMFASFDNLQTRMLYQGPQKQMQMAVGKGETEAALEALNGFRSFGFCEDGAAYQNRFLAELGRAPLSEATHENRGPRRCIEAGNDLAREVLSPWFEADQVLYDGARKLAAQ